jgi:type IV pilus assembly protein PilM
MAAPNRILSLNLGIQTVSLAEFRTSSSGGLILHAYRQTELLADPAADATRSAQTKIAIQEMLGALGIKSDKVNYAVSGQSVFTRFVKLPPVEADQVDQIITFEAQQNVPFPISEVVWDYQLVGGSSAENKIEVVLVAIKSDLLDDCNSAVQDAGLSTNIVDVAPMALYNAFRYNYSDLDGTSLIIDIGARTTNLLFVEGKKIFSRSIPIGGSTVTANIAKEFNEPFATAEQRKKDTGFVSLGGAYAEPSDPDVSRVSKIIRNTLTRLHSEISRSISFYRSQQQGSQPVRVFLSGGSTNLPYMREFFSEKLQLPIEYFNALRNVAVGGKVDHQEAGKSAHLLGEVVGLSLRSITDCPMGLNLRPAGVVRAQELSKRRPHIVLAGICALLILAGFWVSFWQKAALEQKALESIQPKVSGLKVLEGKFDAVKKELKAQQDTVAPLLQVVNEREYWSKIIDDVNSRLPEKLIWITNFEPGTFNATGFNSSIGGSLSERKSQDQPQSGGGKAGVKITGLYIDNPQGAAVVDEFVKNLSESPYYDAEMKKRTPPTGTEWGYDYELQLTLKTPISFQ